MAARTYLPRVVDDQIKSDLAVMGAVVLEGPRACGSMSMRPRQNSSGWTPAWFSMAQFHGLLKNPFTLDCLFESLVARDLSVHGQAIDASVFHYRERNGDLEVTAGEYAYRRDDNVYVAPIATLKP